jgi:hypothetical protein
VKTSKNELLKFFKDMYTMRRMEITNDTEYKVIIFRKSIQCCNSLLYRLETFVDSVIYMTVKKPLQLVPRRLSVRKIVGWLRIDAIALR